MLNSKASKVIDRSVEEAIGRDLAQTFFDVVGLSKPRPGAEVEVLPGDEPGAGPAPDADAEDADRDRERERNRNRNRETDRDTQAEAEQQSNNFISTANNSDPRATDPVISKLQKR